MKINDLIKRYDENDRNIMTFRLEDEDSDGVIEQLDKIVLFGIASGALGDGARLPKLSDTKDDALNCSRGSLYVFYNEFRKRAESYLGLKEGELKEDDPSEQIKEHVVRLKYSETFFNLCERVFIDGLDLKAAVSKKDDRLKRDENNPGLKAEIDDVVKQCAVLRYPKQKILKYFHEKMYKSFFDMENRVLYSRLTQALQDKYRAFDYGRTVTALDRIYEELALEAAAEEKGKKRDILITDVAVPYEAQLTDKWNVTYFDGENGLSFSSLNFAKGDVEYVKYDVIFCPDHSFSEALLSADNMIGFLLTVKNKLKKGGKLIVNTFDPNEKYVEQAKEHNVQTKFDVLLCSDGSVTYTDGTTGICKDKELYNDLVARVPAAVWQEDEKKKREEWDTASVKKTSNFIHCDMRCDELKENLGLSATDESVKVWSMLEEVKYVATYEANKDVAEDVASRLSFGNYLDAKNNYLDDCVIMRNMIEYVLIDPTSFRRVLKLCGFASKVMDADFEREYDGTETKKEVNYICSVE